MIVEIEGKKVKVFYPRIVNILSNSVEEYVHLAYLIVGFWRTRHFSNPSYRLVIG